MTAPSNIVVLWAGPESKNLGVRVLARGTEAILREAFGEAPRIMFRDFEDGGELAGLNKAAVLREMKHLGNGEVKHALRDADLVVDTGAGDSFTDIYGLKRHSLMMYVRARAIRMGIPIVFGPQTIGPFNSRLGGRSSRWALQRSRAVFARDSMSAGAARRLGARSVEATTDVVFALGRPDRSRGRDVIVNVSGLLWFGNGHVDHIAYRDFVLRLIRELSGGGREVTLMPHVLDSANADNDVPAIRKLSESLAAPVDIVIPNGLSHARELLASARLVLGSRMHACLNALSVGTPAVPLAYSRKFAPLLGDLGWEHTIDLREPEGLMARVRERIDAIEGDPEETQSALERLNASAAVGVGNAVSSLRSIGAAL
jgi:polysaccharide pyruvyl transferase WcaK-like protein